MNLVEHLPTATESLAWKAVCDSAMARLRGSKRAGSMARLAEGRGTGHVSDLLQFDYLAADVLVDVEYSEGLLLSRSCACCAAGG